MALTRRYSSVLASLAGIAVSLPAFAAVDEMVISSERREQRMQEVPIAVTAISQEDLENLQVYLSPPNAHNLSEQVGSI